jgi:hypothetical protein
MRALLNGCPRFAQEAFESGLFSHVLTQFVWKDHDAWKWLYGQMPEIVELVLHQTQQALKLCMKVLDYELLFKKANKELYQWMRELLELLIELLPLQEGICEREPVYPFRSIAQISLELTWEKDRFGAHMIAQPLIEHLELLEKLATRFRKLTNSSCSSFYRFEIRGGWRTDFHSLEMEFWFICTEFLDWLFDNGIELEDGSLATALKVLNLCLEV